MKRSRDFEKDCVNDNSVTLNSNNSSAFTLVSFRLIGKSTHYLHSNILSILGKYKLLLNGGDFRSMNVHNHSAIVFSV